MDIVKQPWGVKLDNPKVVIAIVTNEPVCTCTDEFLPAVISSDHNAALVAAMESGEEYPS